MLLLHQSQPTNVGEKISSIIADGPAIRNGDLALGKIFFMAFMPWKDTTMKMLFDIRQIEKDDVFTSIRIEKYEIEAKNKIRWWRNNKRNSECFRSASKKFRWKRELLEVSSKVEQEI